MGLLNPYGSSDLRVEHGERTVEVHFKDQIECFEVVKVAYTPAENIILDIKGCDEEVWLSQYNVLKVRDFVDNSNGGDS